MNLMKKFICLLAVIAVISMTAGCSSKDEAPEVVSSVEVTDTVLTLDDITEELNNSDYTIVLSDIYTKEDTKRFNLVYKYGKKFTLMLTNVYTEEDKGLGQIGTLKALNGYCFDESVYEVSGMQFTMQDNKTLVTDMLSSDNVSTLTRDYAASKEVTVLFGTQQAAESSNSELAWDYIEDALSNGNATNMTYVVSDVYDDGSTTCFDVKMVYRNEFSMCIKNIYETDGTYLGSKYMLEACAGYSFEDLSAITYFGELESCDNKQLVSTLQTLEGMTSLEADKRLIERQVADMQSMHNIQDSYDKMMEELTNMDVTLSESGTREMLNIFSDDTHYIHVLNTDGVVACQTTDTDLIEINTSNTNTLEVKPLKNGNGKITISDTNGNYCVITVYVNMQ